MVIDRQPKKIRQAVNSIKFFKILKLSQGTPYSKMLNSSKIVISRLDKYFNKKALGKRTNDGTLKDNVPVVIHPYKIIFSSLFSTRFVPDSGCLP